MPEQRLGNSNVRVTSAAAGVLESAQELARRTTGKRLIHARHLLGALLTASGGESGSTRPLAFKEIDSKGANLDDLRFRFREYIESGGRHTSEPDDLDEWRAHFAGFFQEVRRIPSFDPEGLRGPDQLGIMPDVRAFAMLTAAKDVAPPLSIGLFGDWGSGKSFFMQKLRDEIQRIAEDAKKKNDAGDDTPFHASVLQIEFNAWHYVETNLWASLVTHIFDSLNQHFTRGGKVEDRERWDELLKKLGQEGDALHDAEAALDAARKDLQAAAQKESRARSGALAIAKAAWSGVKASGSWFEKDQQDLTAVLGDKGVERLQSDIVERSKEVSALYGRTRLTFSALWGQVRHVKTFGVALLSSLVAAWTLVELVGRLDPELLRGTVRLLVTVGGLVLGWVGAAVRRANRALSLIEAVHERIKENLKKSPYSDALQDAQLAVGEANRRVEAHRERVQQVRSELRGLLPGQRLTSFLKERASSDDYRKHLGLPALVRRDFEELHRLMVKRSTFRVPAESTIKELDEERIPELLRNILGDNDFPLQATSDAIVEIDMKGKRWRIRDRENGRVIHIRKDGADLQCVSRWDVPDIDRIILYVDDLDRCPEDRVVDVLQAIHLLLALPLFVVVVGVDARWVSRSLELRYQQLWNVTDSETGRSPGGAASPQDYLEKIFQIPFWLEPMDSGSTRRLLRSLLPVGSGKTAERTILRPSHVRPLQSNQDAGTEAIAESTQQRIVFPRSQPESGETASSLPEEEAAEAKDAEPLPESLALQARERDLMLDLSKVVGRSPRAVKRFVNVYRLYRARISDPVELESLVGTDENPGHFRAVLILLAIITGKPEAAENVFRQIDDENPDLKLYDFVTKGGRRILGPPIKWEAFSKFLEEYTDVGAGRGMVMRDLQRHLREIGRYSFRVGWL